MKDYLLEAIQKGEAIDTRDTESMKEYVASKLVFLTEVFGDEWVKKFVNKWVDQFKETDVMLKLDIDNSISNWLPVVMIEAYKKILNDFRKELTSLKK